ncbi:hypothetical protein IT397_03250 [Candidatus Nomurabacteria bacterium]|nr:hypothetical protein [Candidatus Nomurabacteria bacterium]
MKSEDDGLISLQHMLSFLKRGIPVVACEKLALANYRKYLRKYLRILGINATVGGGSGFPSIIENFSFINEVCLVANTTMSFIFAEVAKGLPVSQALERAVEMQLSEKGKDDLFDVCRGEIFDNLSKAVNIGNLITGKCVRLSDQKVSLFTREHLDELLKDPSMVRLSFVVCKRRHIPGQGFCHFGRSHFRVGDMEVIAGFKRYDHKHPMARPTLPMGVRNRMIVWRELDGTEVNCLFEGDGAGPEPTAGMMIGDANMLLQ